MPPAVAGLSGSCASIPCRFSYPEELRPSSVQGLWYFGSPYPKNYPPVVARSRPGAVHESFAGRARLVGDPGLRDCSLELGPPLSAELGGRYYFRGDLGGYNQFSFSEHAALQVLDEPVLEVPSEVVAGALAELRCRVPDSCPRQRPRLRWEGAQELPEASEREWREDGAGAASVVSRLRFRPRREDGGRSLGCHVTLPNSSLAFSAGLALDVQYEPQVLEVSGPSEALEGSQVLLGCSAEGRPPPLLTWFRGPQVLREEPGAEALPLHLAQVSPQDSGTYTCVAENRHGRHNRSLELHVAYAPRPPVLNGTLWVLAGEQVRLTCSARSHPAPIVTLARGRRVVAAAVYERQVSLELPAATPEDGGEYLCRAENQHGHSSLAFNVTVEYPPVVLPESRCAPVGEGLARCVCAAAAVPAPSVAFELPWLNLSVAEGHRDFALTWSAPGAVSAALTLRGALEPRLAVLCAARNGHGAARVQLRFHHPGEDWGKTGKNGKNWEKIGENLGFWAQLGLVGPGPCAWPWSRGSPCSVPPGTGMERPGCSSGSTIQVRERKIGRKSVKIGEKTVKIGDLGPAGPSWARPLSKALEPRLAVLCAARNGHGAARVQLRFHHPGENWGKTGEIGEKTVKFGVFGTAGPSWAQPLRGALEPRSPCSAPPGTGTERPGCSSGSTIRVRIGGKRGKTVKIGEKVAKTGRKLVKIWGFGTPGPSWARPLRGALEPQLAVLCAARNGHGVARVQLRFHHPGEDWGELGKKRRKLGKKTAKIGEKTVKIGDLGPAGPSWARPLHGALEPRSPCSAPPGTGTGPPGCSSGSTIRVRIGGKTGKIGEKTVKIGEKTVKIWGFGPCWA
ncbi:Schwann cell myelin protein-like isoform X10 [Agelaius tricolor]